MSDSCVRALLPAELVDERREGLPLRCAIVGTTKPRRLWPPSVCVARAGVRARAMAAAASSSASTMAGVAPLYADESAPLW